MYCVDTLEMLTIISIYITYFGKQLNTQNFFHQKSMKTGLLYTT